MMAAVGDEVVLLDSLNGHYFSLDTVGRRMLDLALSECDIGSVAEKLAAQYDATMERLSEDFTVLMDELQSVGLLVAEGA